jgi:hypothetical protein
MNWICPRVAVNVENQWAWHNLGDSDIAELGKGLKKVLLKQMKLFRAICDELLSPNLCQTQSVGEMLT